MASTQKAQRVSLASELKGQASRGLTAPHAMITQRQKQALMDNIQLEITERARKLRAQYALQAQSLHTRIELRVNRIPTSLRNVTMGELLQRYAVSANSERQKTVVVKKSNGKTATAASKSQGSNTASCPESRGVKRTSELIDDDKENTPDPSQVVANPKKRMKANNERRVPDPSTVLSPKSSNSQTLPRSPGRARLGSQKANIHSQPASPLKTASPVKVAAPAATDKSRTAKPTANTGSTRSKAAPKSAATAEIKSYAARTKRDLAVNSNRAASSASSNTSGLSGTSAGTMIVKKAGRAIGASGVAAGKKATGVAATGQVRKTTTAAAKMGMTTVGAVGRRTLRKRA